MCVCLFVCLCYTGSFKYNCFFLFLVCVSVVVYGVDQYSLSYSYFDEMAQSYCAASNKYWTFAIRRDCSGVAPTCHDICKKATYEIISSIGNQKSR